MSLPACQERILSGIESALRTCEPHLASRFAIFARLTRDEELPRTEQLAPRPSPPWRWLKRAGRAGRVSSHGRRPAGGAPVGAARLRAAILIPIVLIAMAVAVVLASNTGANACAPVPHRPAGAPTRWVTCAASGAGAHGAQTTGAAAQGSHR
jgi:hypothetical protein